MMSRPSKPRFRFELVRDKPRGLVVGFKCAPSRLEEGLERVPDLAILAAYADAWAPATAPERSIERLRVLILAKHRQTLARERDTGPRLLSISEASLELGISPRGLRDQVERGARPRHFIKGRSGNARTLAVEVPAAEIARVFRLIPARLKPDQRLRLTQR